MVNGIPCKIKTPDEKGNLTNVETFYFATYRKCPELAKYPKEIRSLSNKTAILNRRKEILEEKLATSQEADLDILQISLDDISAQIEDTSDKIVSLFQEFVSTGLKAAGYDDASIERYSQYVTMERFRELIEKSRMGSGMCDFF